MNLNIQQVKRMAHKKLKKMTQHIFLISLLNFILMDFSMAQNEPYFEISTKIKYSESYCDIPKNIEDSIFCKWYETDSMEKWIKTYYELCPDSLLPTLHKDFNVDSFDSLINTQKSIVRQFLVGKEGIITDRLKPYFYYDYLAFRYMLLRKGIDHYLYEKNVYGNKN